MGSKQGRQKAAIVRHLTFTCVAYHLERAKKTLKVNTKRNRQLSMTGPRPKRQPVNVGSENQNETTNGSTSSCSCFFVAAAVAVVGYLT